ncbi:MAG: GNAT family N-acetyltransferase [Flaviflexus sp.]|nr:GNAT family N-acetyltransferase [Flaviflexus sp.]
MSADDFVRPAIVSDVEPIGKIHAATMTATLEAALDRGIPADVASQITPASLTPGWSQALTAPPSPNYRVLTAVSHTRIVGFAALAPADQELGSAPPEEPAPIVAEILALEVPEPDGRRGHGSRLLSACADLAKEQNATELQVWIAVGDEAHIRFYSSAGFAPRGLQRTLAVGDDEVVEQCWYALLGEAPPAGEPR